MWKITGCTSGGYQALREDGELMFIYRRPNWGEGRCGSRAFLELRNRGELVGRITAEDSWRPELKAEWLGRPDRTVNETDLLEIAEALKL